MRNWTRSIVIVAVLLLVSAAPVTSAHADRSPVLMTSAVFMYRGPSIIDPSETCPVTFIRVLTFTSKEKPHSRQVEVRVTETDECDLDGDDLIGKFYGLQTVSGGELRIDSKLRDAHVVTSLAACNVADPSQCLALDLDLSWFGTGIVTERTYGTFRNGVATGTIFDTTYGRDLAPESSGSGGLFALFTESCPPLCIGP
jgi:hypothetical protein